MAEHVVAAVLQRAGAAVIQEAASLRQVPAKVETLKSELRRMQCFLRDTDARMERGEMANHLVSEVRDVAYSIEIIIDMANILARENNIKRSFMGAMSKGAHYPFHCMHLVVLDDVWRMEDWDMIQAAFPDVKNGSRMVVTTRNSAVSNHPNTRKIIQDLKLLNDEESIELFNRKAFPPYVVHDRNDMDSFREIGKALALKCNGLPLAIVVLGGFLSKNLRITEWRRMVASINWDAMKNEGDIKAILDLSYYDLSSNMKACFLYITSFPEDYAVPVGLLTKLWIAEGFIPNVRECSLAETALRYVEELAQRCMVLTEKRSSRCIKTVKVHDVLRDWGIGRARREGFFKDCSSSNDVETSYSNEMRAYRVVLYDSVCVKVGIAIPNLHSLLILNAARLEWNAAFFFHGLYYLRVLYVDGMRGKWQLPTDIGKMVHLRYLGLKGGTYVLPASISNLTNLHTFDARDATVEALPIALLSIWTLKHVHIYKVESWSMLKTTIQSNLKSLFILLASNMPKQWEAAIERMESNPSWCFGRHYQSVKQLEIVGSFEDKFGVPNDLHLPDLLLLPHNLRRLKFSCPNLLNDEDPMPTLGSWLPFSTGQDARLSSGQVRKTSSM